MTEQALRLLAPALLAAGTAVWVDRTTEARGYLPPGLAVRWRRMAALFVLTSIFYVGVFLPVGMIGSDRFSMEEPLEISTPELFLLHALLLVTLLAWYALGYGGSARPPSQGAVAGFARQLGLRTNRPLLEVGIGIAAGIGGWALTLLLMMAAAGAVWALGGEDLLPAEPPQLVPLIAGLPWVVRLGLGVSAGVVEELFFRGFLQPRVGVALSTVLFVLAHLSYDQPFMLVGVTALSLLFAALVVWRRNVWAAIVAHAVFDLVQLLVVIPEVLERLPDLAPASILLT